MEILFAFLGLLAFSAAQFDPHFIGKRQGIVHLFEWKWLDIAKECEDFLGPKGYGGVQTSPVNENAVIASRPWYERYQPMSFKIQTRSGNESEFAEMVQRCRKAGVRIFVDVVVNHMAAPGPSAPLNGTAGSQADPLARYFPAVPFNRNDFHASCLIQDYSNATQVRNCELSSLPDLDQANSEVRDKIVDFMNHLVDLGVAGFRMDACKHMSPSDLRVIYRRVKSLSTDNGFVRNARPFLFQEVIDMGNEAVKRQEYTIFGTVTEFTYSTQLGMVFKKIDRDLSALQRWGPLSGFLPSRYSFVFVDNHDNQRGHGSGGSMILNYKDGSLYAKAAAFMLAHPHGGNHPRVMSSFAFDDPNIGPPQDNDENIVSRGIDSNGQCTNGWVCEHRWNAIANMIKFRAATDGSLVRFFTNIAENQISFCRGNKGLIVINNSERNLTATVRACVPDGTYCDVISGDLVDGKCTGKAVIVKGGKTTVELARNSDGVLAIHVDACLAKNLIWPKILSFNALDQSALPIDVSDLSESSSESDESDSSDSEDSEE
jgi:alpha-amylase